MKMVTLTDGEVSATESGPPVGETVFSSYENLAKAAEDLEEQGWNKIPCDCPASGEIGYMLYRNLTDVPEKEETRLLMWRPFGILETETTLLFSDASHKIPDAVNAIVGKRLFKCDDPRSRLIGFVHYDVPGKATILQMALTAIKNVGGGLKVEGRPFLEWRNEVPDFRSIVAPFVGPS